jgi:hypothetical protein
MGQDDDVRVPKGGGPSIVPGLGSISRPLLVKEGREGSGQGGCKGRGVAQWGGYWSAVTEVLCVGHQKGGGEHIMAAHTSSSCKNRAMLVCQRFQDESLFSHPVCGQCLPLLCITSKGWISAWHCCVLKGKQEVLVGCCPDTWGILGHMFCLPLSRVGYGPSWLWPVRHM